MVEVVFTIDHMKNKARFVEERSVAMDEIHEEYNGGSEKTVDGDGGVPSVCYFISCDVVAHFSSPYSAFF